MPVRVCLGVVILASLLVGCGSGGHAPGMGDPNDGIVPIGDGGTPNAATDAGCLEGEEGCPCDTVGATASCGLVKRISGSYVSCSPGKATCTSALRWGPCMGDQVAHNVVESAAQAQ